jgi:hypothetical protein
MARRFRRDLIGHFIRNEQRTQQPCTHACCRGYRVHPANMPVILPNRTLRSASDADLAAHFERVSQEDTPKSRRAEAQIMHEMDRRDRDTRRRESRQARRLAVEQARRSNRAARNMERESELHRMQLAAEEGTKGYLVSAEGQARGITDREILSGRERVFIRYATPEAKAYFAENPRPTAGHFRGRDTRILYSDRPTRRRRRAVTV